MENQAFEEEQHSRIQEAANLSQQATSLPFRPGIDLFADLSLSNSDGHVYEDILPCVEEVSTLPSASLVQDLSRSSASALQRQLETLDYVSRESETKSPEQTGIPTFRRNLTLPFRSSAGGLEASATGCSSVRVTSRERNSCTEEDADDARTPLEDALASRGGQARAQSGCRPNRRRRKKDCKHCRSKAAASASARVCDVDHRDQQEATLRENQQPQLIVDPCHLGMIAAVRSPGGMVERKELAGLGNDPTVFTVSANLGGSPGNTLKLIEYERNDAGPIRGANDGKALITPEKNRAGMRVNSIYSQDRWYAKEAPIFSTVVKEHGTFQRAYSLPARTQTPSSQNRANLRRSVRSEPPPHPARLHKHRRGWTLHLASPLESSKRTRSLILLLILVLTLLGIGGVALYIVFEPEKLQIIQQYLKSSANTSARHNTLSAGTFLSSPKSDQENDTSTATTASSTLPASVALSDDQSFPDNGTGTSTVLETETEGSSPSSLNSTRYCDDCLAEEVCVAIVDEPVPICRIGIDREDPTGCAGFCLINKQKCHRLDVDAFRCVEVEHYCLDDEWACSNTLCIPLEKRCDGHMNCYDHSDEYDCVCDPETHFQCGNETSCLPLEKRCDGKIDCWDAADEINCTLGRNLGRSCPLENEFTCSNGQCILKARFCDGLPDCLDGSDEPHGCQGRCNKHEFTCQNNRCIAKGMKCNGVDDCGDGTDERHCKDRLP